MLLSDTTESGSPGTNFSVAMDIVVRVMTSPPVSGIALENASIACSHKTCSEYTLGCKCQIALSARQDRVLRREASSWSVHSRPKRLIAAPDVHCLKEVLHRDGYGLRTKEQSSSCRSWSVKKLVIPVSLFWLTLQGFSGWPNASRSSPPYLRESYIDVAGSRVLRRHPR